MCIIAKNVKIAKKDITVWKVWHREKTPHEEIKLATVVSLGATKFDIGFGYSAFLTRKNARTYKKTILSSCWGTCRSVPPSSVTVRKMFIPRGTKYAIGEIEFDCYCAGLPAVRCKRLKEVTP